ncbi:MAG: 2OG-Fe dioxygenase family protein [Acidimicrobiia bacterium]|nr:2OG-Fe dioxygenase family protein [Acidimicrobiia bacterium]
MNALSVEAAAHIESAMEAVPIDEYLADGTRAKAISRVEVHDAGVVVGPHAPLFQSAAYNPIHGDLVREYAPIARDLLELLEPARRSFSEVLGLAPDNEILVQTQRIRAIAGPDGLRGSPAVEGWHQDGVDYIGVAVVSRVGITGATTYLATNSHGEAPVVAEVLHPGQMIVFSDRDYWHYTTDIHAQDVEAAAYRDVILLAYPSAREDLELAA